MNFLGNEPWPSTNSEFVAALINQVCIATAFHDFWTQIAIAALLTSYWQYVRVGMGNDDFRNPGTWMWHFEFDGLFRLREDLYSKDVV